MSVKRTQLNITISPESLDSLKSQAIKSGQTLGSFVNNILNEYIQNSEEENPSNKEFSKRIDSLEMKIENLNKKLSEK